jgi:hypothetical protein
MHPLVCKPLHLLAEIGILMLRSELPGGHRNEWGDFDNRLKTLFDALRVPGVPQEIASNTRPSSANEPHFTLLEDERLSRVSTSKPIGLLARRIRISVLTTEPAPTRGAITPGPRRSFTAEVVRGPRCPQKPPCPHHPCNHLGQCQHQRIRSHSGADRRRVKNDTADSFKMTSGQFGHSPKSTS